MKLYQSFTTIVIIAFSVAVALRSTRSYTKECTYLHAENLGRFSKKVQGSRDNVQTSKTECWRIYDVDVLFDDDPGKDSYSVTPALLSSVVHSIGLKTPNALTENDVAIVRKAFDGRWKKVGQPKWSYTVDVNISSFLARKLNIRSLPGRIDKISDSDRMAEGTVNISLQKSKPASLSKSKVVIVGAGPAGLFAAISLVQSGINPTIVERGFPVEQRGKDIGALFNRKILNAESNLCYGEGGAGTWSDGKLTTQIGKNSADVREVLHTLVLHGASERILIDGKPHVGTDKLVRILRDLRAWLLDKGAVFKFGCKVEDISTRDGRVSGVKLGDGTSLEADAVVLAVGHSARTLYSCLMNQGVQVEAKSIAVGFRIEHPQELINKIRFGRFGELCNRGKGVVPVADYKLAARVSDGERERGCYSFCMCPGGQIVPTSVNPDELCINGMSFSQRQSPWANSALVVELRPEDMADLGGTGPLRGVEWQRVIERRAAVMGGGNLVVPVQRATDFMAGVATAADGGLAGPLTSSYRLGVRGAACHELYPEYITATLRAALLEFEEKMPGYLCSDALLHGVETRTSAPVQITRDRVSLQCPTVAGLYPAGEGAGYAGGIVSAAVDGMRIGKAIAAGGLEPSQQEML